MLSLRLHVSLSSLQETKFFLSSMKAFHLSVCVLFYCLQLSAAPCEYMLPVVVAANELHVLQSTLTSCNCGGHII